MKAAKRQKTIGIVIFRREEDKIFYLLLHHGGRYWNFPKGRQEAGETQRQTALRELREETGITKLTFIRGFRDGYDYSFRGEIYRQPGMVYKRAIFFLGQTDERAVTIYEEHRDFGWFDYPAARRKITYPAGHKLLDHAHRFLSKR